MSLCINVPKTLNLKSTAIVERSLSFDLFPAGRCRWRGRWTSWLRLELCITTRGATRRRCRCTKRLPHCSRTAPTSGWLWWTNTHTLKHLCVCMSACLCEWALVCVCVSERLCVRDWAHVSERVCVFEWACACVYVSERLCVSEQHPTVFTFFVKTWKHYLLHKYTHTHIHIHTCCNCPRLRY